MEQRRGDEAMGPMKKKVVIREVEIGGGNQPLICTPLIGHTISDLVSECNKILPKKPDIIEWRADFFTALENRDEVIRAGQQIRELCKDTPILFTIRSVREGGQPIALTENEKVHLIKEVCQSKLVDLVDYEMVNESDDINVVQEAAQRAGVYLVLSYHNFDRTPDIAFIVDKLHEAQRQGADIAKVAVMPNSKEDVLTLMNATQAAQKDLQVPVITISMGELGVLTRIAGWMFGSTFTFAVGNESSAPGQVPIEDLRVAIQALQNVSRNN